MNTVPPIIPISDLRQDAAAVLKSIKNSDQPTVITQRGRAAAIMLSIESYEQSLHDKELLIRLARGEKEVEAGEGYSLDEVLSEADSILKAKE